MSDFSLTLVLQIKTSKIINDMAKVQQKSEKISAFGGILFVLDKFDSILSSVIDSHLGLRSRLIGYQYSEIIRAVFSVFCCGGDCMEDLNLYLKDVLTERPHTRFPSADTVLRGIEELATENISYTAEKTGNVYDFNTAEKLNQLLIKLLLATGQLTEGGAYDVDFDHQFLEAEKYDSKRTYKGFDGYSPGVFTIGGLIAYLENRDGNANVRFMQAETHRRFFEMMRSFGIHVRSFRADCGSYSEDIVKMVMEHTDKFYIRAERYAGLYEKVKHYNKRGTAEQVFDRQNNDFGWAHLPKSFMNQNTVFLLITAMAANFYRYIVALPLMAVLFGIKATDRVKSFLFRFIAVPAKWIRTARQYKLNIYSNKPYKLIWEHG